MLKLAICDDLKTDRDLLISLIKGMSFNNDLDYDFEMSFFTCGEELENHYEDKKSSFDIIVDCQVELDTFFNFSRLELNTSF